MLGTEDAPGPMRKVVGELDKDDYCEEMFRQFAINLGFVMQDLRKGTFNDEHESKFNQKDRRNRFIPQYLHYYENSPHMYKGEDRDALEDLQVQNCHFVTITGTDGKVKKISLGGELPPGDGPVYLLASYVESCFKAGKLCTRARVEDKRQSCMDKSEGPSHHLACLTVEWGNGCICLDPGGPPPLLIPIHS